MITPIWIQNAATTLKQRFGSSGFKLAEIETTLNCKRNTAYSVVYQLKTAGVLERVRRGYYRFVRSHNMNGVSPSSAIQELPRVNLQTLLHGLRHYLVTGSCALFELKGWSPVAPRDYDIAVPIDKPIPKRFNSPQVHLVPFLKSKELQSPGTEDVTTKGIRYAATDLALTHLLDICELGLRSVDFIYEILPYLSIPSNDPRVLVLRFLLNDLFGTDLEVPVGLHLDQKPCGHMLFVPYLEYLLRKEQWKDSDLKQQARRLENLWEVVGIKITLPLQRIRDYLAHFGPPRTAS